MKITPAILLLLIAAPALAATAPAKAPTPAAPPAAAPVLRPVQTPPSTGGAPAPPVAATLFLRGLEKITGKPTNITAPIGKTVKFASLTITARFCYSTPASETPETAAFVQIDDHRPDQSQRRIFSGWMYASSPGLNGMEHPLYDVWVINCSNGTAPPATGAAAGPVSVASPDSSDKDDTEALPEDAGK